MALRGQKPKPVSLKLIQGNPGKRSLRTVVSPPKDGEIPCPVGVDRNPRAKAYWDMYVENAAPGHLAPLDGPLLAGLCIALSIRDEAQEKMEETGLLVRAPRTGTPMPSPYMTVVNRQTEIIRQLAVVLALPPAERNRIASPDVRERVPAELEEFLS